jgi:hypothetical protein
MTERSRKVTTSPRLRRGMLILFALVAIPFVAAAQATKVASTEGNYSAIFPAPAQRTVEPPKTINGLTFSLEGYQAVTARQMFMTVFTRYTGGVIDTQKELDLNVENFVKTTKGRLMSKQSIDYVSGSRKIAGIDFTGDTDQFGFHGRFYVAGNDVWGIIYVAPVEASSAAMKEQFFRSLKIGESNTKGEHR